MGLLSTIGNAIMLGADGGWVTKPADDDYWYLPRGVTTQAGVDVDEETALTFATVFACVAKLSKTIAALPVHVVERSPDRKRRIVDHELNDILGTQASDEATGFTFREALIANTMLWGNGYAEIIRSRDGENVRQMIVVPSKYMSVKRDETGRLIYEQRTKGMPVQFPPSDMLHIPGLSLNGITGLSVIGLAREAVGLGMAATQFGASFFGNGAWAGGFVQQPLEAPEISHDAVQKFLADLNEKFRGPDKAFGFGFLREGWQFKQIEMPLEDAQFLQTRKFQREEICGIFDVPPTKIGDFSHATYSNVEQADLAWAKDALLPWCVRIEAAVRRQFFGGTRLYLRHNLAGVVRGDIKARYSAYAVGRQWGWLSRNDIREMEDMNPIEGGDDYLTPLNMTTLSAEQAQHVAAMVAERLNGSDNGQPKRLEAKTSSETIEEKEKIIESFSPVVEAAASRIVARETTQVERAFARSAKASNPDGFMAWLGRYEKEHAAYVADAIDSIFAARQLATGSLLATSVSTAAQEYVTETINTLRQYAQDSPGAIPAIIDGWREQKPRQLADKLMDRLRG